MGEGGGFLRVRAVVNQASSCCPWLIPSVLPVVYPNTKSVFEGELINLWLVLMQDQVIK